MYGRPYNGLTSRCSTGLQTLKKGESIDPSNVSSPQLGCCVGLGAGVGASGSSWSQAGSGAACRVPFGDVDHVVVGSMSDGPMLSRSFIRTPVHHSMRSIR